ncbi:6307_t:CDS:2, partial [Gigaspora margarita]
SLDNQDFQRCTSVEINYAIITEYQEMMAFVDIVDGIKIIAACSQRIKKRFDESSTSTKIVMKRHVAFDLCSLIQETCNSVRLNSSKGNFDDHVSLIKSGKIKLLMNNRFQNQVKTCNPEFIISSLGFNTESVTGN